MSSSLERLAAQIEVLVDQLAKVSNALVDSLSREDEREVQDDRTP